ncbi:MAG TPA: fibronectin type III domain-containing protein [Cytophagaceae bacterium]
MISFTYIEDCQPPLHIDVDVESEVRVKVSWDQASNHSKYLIRYREKDNTLAEWFTTEVTTDNIKITDLKPGKSYEYQVQSFCSRSISSFSAMSYFDTPERDTSKTRECSQGDIVSVVDNQTLLASATNNDVFKLGRFDLRVTEISGSEGIYSGKGTINVPFLQSNVKVKFSEISVNANKEVFDGKVIAEMEEIKSTSTKTFQLKIDICEKKTSKEDDEELDKNNGSTSEKDTTSSIILELNYGDTIILNGNVVVVDAETQINSGDTVVVNDVTYVATGNNTFTPISTGSSFSDIGQASKKVEKYIDGVIKDIENDNDKKLSSERKNSENYRKQLEGLIKLSGLDRMIVVGEGDIYIKEGMSKEFTLPAKINEDRMEIEKIRNIKEKHIQLYKSDSLLQIYISQSPIIKELKKETSLPSLIMLVEDSLKKLPQNVVNELEGEKERMKNFIKGVIEKEVIRIRTQDDPNQGDLDLRGGDAWCLSEARQETFIDGYNPVLDVLTVLIEKELISSSLANEEKVSRVNALYDYIKNSEQNNSISKSGPQKLPIGINKEIGGREYIVGIDSMVFTPVNARLSAFMILEDPLSESRLAFGGSNIEFYPGGIGGGTESRLVLLTDVPIRISNQLKLIIQAQDDKTFVEWDCNGFKSMGVKGEFEFCRDFLVPETPDGEIAPEPERVKASFETLMPEWGDIIAKVSVTPFQVKGLNGYGFIVKDAWVDFSELSNPVGLVFPEDYKGLDLLAGNDKLWQGFYIKQLSVKIPKKFETTDNKDRSEFGAYNVLIDHSGLTGTLYGKEVIPLEKGIIGNWAFSLDSLGLSLQSNQLVSAGLKGSMVVPLFKEDTPFNYSAVVSIKNDSTNYLFTVNNRDTLNMPVWKANVSLLPTSYIQVKIQDKKFLPEACLNGTISVNADLGGGNTSTLAGVSFEELEVKTVKPYVSGGRWSLTELSLKGKSNNHKLAGFPISINNIKVLDKGSEEIGLRFDVAVNLMKDSEGGFAAETTIETYGRLSFSNGIRQIWKHDRTNISDIKINVDGGAFTIEGILTLYKQDAVYGNGFKGTVNATFTPGLKVSATAQFGKVKELRYWYVDALASIPNGVAVFAGLGLYGFGGGAYHHMRQQNFSKVALPEVTSSVVAVDNDKETSGKSLSGVRYVPDESYFLGLKASVVIGTHPSPNAFNGDVTFEIAFNNNGGVNSIGFQGNGYFMTKVTDRGSEVPVKAGVAISYDFQNKVLHGNLEVYINVAGTVKGKHANNLAGAAVIHVERSEWYIHIGTPSKRVGVSFVGMFDLESYFMVGTKIEPMPVPPDNVSRILGGEDLDFMRDENAMAKGGGFAFGSSMTFRTGNLNFLIFYASFDAGMGFDIMLRNYGDISCAGRSKPIGIKGWYASGQAYAYLEGEIGAQVKVFGDRRNVKVLDIAAAAVMQAKLPNPVWLKGVVGGEFSVLGGLVKGNCKFEVVIGEECEIQLKTNPFAELGVIADLTPSEASRDVSVFTTPQVVFNMPLEKSFELVDQNDKKKAYRIVLDKFIVKADDKEIPGYFEWNQSKDVLVFTSYDVLPQKRTIKAGVRVYFEEFTGGTWKPVVVDGQIADEIKQVTFTTGEAPPYIPASNVEYSYPINNQYNFYKSEYGSGYIKLKIGQPYLFEPSSTWRKEVRFTPAGNGKVSSVPVSYDGKERRVNFSIPSDLTNDRVYKMEIVNLPLKTNAALDANVSTTSKRLEGSDITIQGKKADGALEKLDEVIVYTLNLRTSKYNKFNEKLASFKMTEGWRFPIFEYEGIHEIGSFAEGEELFDSYELYGAAGEAPLISMKALLTHEWHYKYIFPLVYQDYPIKNNIVISWRDIEDKGLVPVKGIYLQQEDDKRILTEEEYSGGGQSFSGRSNIRYQMPYYCYRDYHNLQEKAAMDLLGNYKLDPRVEYLLTTSFPSILPGKYEIELIYTLPGINKVTSKYNLTIVNP